MMRALWTAASGMTAQQTNVDTISNNLSNINTTGYKTERVEFQSLLYQTIQDTSTDSQGNQKPVGVQVGLGTRSSAVTSQFTQGNLYESEGAFDFAIEGDGFFKVQMPDGSTAYTRNGSFKMSIGTDGLTLCTSQGYPILDTNDQPMVFDTSYSSDKLKVDDNGNFTYPDAHGNPQSLGVQIGLVQFNNPAGLEKESGSLYKETDASGTPRKEGEDGELKLSLLHQGYLEGSNVQSVDEMVNLIVAQRAYEMNSKAITAADEMLQQANNLRN